MKIHAKRFGIAALLLLAVCGGVSALPSHSYEIEYYDDFGNLVGYDSYYCGRNHGGLDWGYRTDISIYYDLGPCQPPVDGHF